MRVFRMTAVGAGAVDYLLRGSGCDHAREHADVAREEPDAAGYFASAVEHGEPAGVWHGRGMDALGLDARPGDTARDDDVRAIFGQLRRPESSEAAPEWIGSKPRRYRDTETRLADLLAKEPDAPPERVRELELQAATSGRRAVAYFDFTFSPAKSVSVYYASLLAAGLTDDAAAVRRAHDEAVKIAIDYAEQHVAWTRRGYHGRDGDGRSICEFVEGTGLSVITFSHSTSREAEPQLHTHGAVLNRTATEDGHIGALDSKGFRNIKEAVGTAYERALEQLVTETFGVVFETRPDGIAREIVGVDPELCDDASTRRHQVVERVEDLVAAYRERHGAEPDAAARKAMAQAATLETRRPKTGLAGPAAVAAWAVERRDWCERVLDQVDDAAIAARATATEGMAAGDRTSGPVADDREPDRRTAWLAAAKAAGIQDVQAKYSTWTLGNLVDAIDRHLGDAAELGVPAAERAAVVEELAREAVAPDAGLDVVQVTGHEPIAVPAAMRRASDGRPWFRPHMDERYSTGAHLAVEEHVVALARQQCGAVVDDPALDERLTALGLSEDQRSAVAGVMTTDRGAAVLIGPAGAGKSRTVGALAHEWTAATRGRVFGVATSQIATANLAGDGLHAINVRRFLGRFDGDDPRDRLSDQDLLVVDEAGMSASSDLEKLARIAASAGARIVYTGDPEQLDAVGAGGLFAHLAETLEPGQRHDLDQVHRFAATWERDASLRLRDGDHDTVTEYGDRGRLHAGTVEEMQAGAARSYLADTLNGRSSLLIVGTNDDAASLSRQVRDQLIELGRVGTVAVAELADGTPVALGDRLQARRNAYDLRVDPAVDEHGRVGERRPVTNRETYTVVGVDDHGQVLARDSRGAVAHLPTRYVERDTVLGYAVTVHGAQGVTVDTAHPVIDRDATREHAYVGGTRGREANHFWLVTEREPDEHEPQRIAEVSAERLLAVLANRGAQRAATSTRDAADRDVESLAAAAARFDVVTARSSRERHGALLDEVLKPTDAQRLQQDPGRDRLLRALREAELDGHDTGRVLADAGEASLTTADSVADVLRARIRGATATRTPERTVESSDWTSRVAVARERDAGYANEIGELASQRQARLGQEVAQRAPRWVLDALGEPPERHEGEGPVTEPRGRWEERAGTAAAYRELAGIGDGQRSLGPAPSRERELHRVLWRDAVDAVGQRGGGDARDLRAAPDADLYAARERWAREQEAAPRWVADELAERHDLARQYREDAAVEAARLAAMGPEDLGRDDLTQRLERSEYFAGHHQRVTEDMELAHQERRTWWSERADERQANQAAADELERRGLPLERLTEAREREVAAAPVVVPAEAEPPVEEREPLADSVREAQEKVAAARERLEQQRVRAELRVDEERDWHIAVEYPQVQLDINGSHPEIERY